MSQDELLESVWTGVVVGTASVYQSMSQLRKVLGDTDDPPRYIETVARKGYRLVAKVSTPPKPQAPDAPDAEPAARGRVSAREADARRRRAWRWLAWQPPGAGRHGVSPGGCSMRATAVAEMPSDRGAAVHRLDHRQDRAGVLRRAHGRNFQLAGAAAHAARGRPYLGVPVPRSQRRRANHRT